MGKNELVTGKAELHKMPHSGHPVSDVTPEVLKCADATVRENQCMTT